MTVTWGVTTDLPVAATTARGKCTFETATGESRRKYWLSGRASHPQRRKSSLDSMMRLSPNLGERCVFESAEKAEYSAFPGASSRAAPVTEHAPAFEYTTLPKRAAIATYTRAGAGLYG